MNTVGDYHDLYLKADVLLLADVFEKFINTSLDCYDYPYPLYSEFKWLNEKEIERFDLESIGENSSTGYILELDLKYPSELLEISHNMLSNYCCGIADEYGIKIGGVNKLVLDLGNKSKYVLHYRNLQL